MTPFLLDSDAIAAIRAAVERARKRPIPLDMIIRLAKQGIGPFAQRPKTEHVDLPFDYQLSVSVEEQPAGMCLHISMSSPRPVERIPNMIAMAMVLDAAGFQCDDTTLAVDPWVEDFLVNGKPGGKALNVLILLQRKEKQSECTYPNCDCPITFFGEGYKPSWETECPANTKEPA